MFGHLITLNFNKRSNHHKTMIGGFFSIFIKIFLKIYIVLNFVNMFWYKANVNGYYDGTSPMEELGRVHFNDTDTVLFYVLNNQRDDSPVFLGKETSQYIDMYY